MSWTVAAAARRQLRTADVALQAQPTRVSVVGTVSRTGHQTTTAQFNADGSRATVTTSSLRLLTLTQVVQTSVYDTDTGRQIGRTVVTRGSQPASVTSAEETTDEGNPPVINPDGTRALTITGVTDPNTDSKSTDVTVTDTVTGSQVGGVTTLAGEYWPVPVLFGVDGKHAVITTGTYDSRTSTNTMLYSTIDTDTGSKVGTTLALNGFAPVSPIFGDDGRHLTFITSGRSGDIYTTEVGVLDTTTGTQIGSTLVYPNSGVTIWPVFSQDGNRVLILDTLRAPSKPLSTTVSVINTVTGTQVGKTLDFAGGDYGMSAALSPDGAHALIVTTKANWLTLTSTTRVSIVRIA
ncbi:hypothetical protein MJO55_01965 [Mycolicibacterium rufum]|uniref:Uncharacterized protein n=1 Tax=Mycolicibacterium rufum TaxID=318424 RepID=A0A9X3BRM8_9MYCO|nr:hypothetical protein [Mycolicibacterium rufum]KGI66475.1 hypothetical protein EU78_02180 [Mycolicibacterium rufum]MCV7073722.1 hypothetical protein [Mycolicibacterium rufum]ULP37243.1 hypothetical protein MJO55_01965 [Mycolicibacterium rufum]